VAQPLLAGVAQTDSQAARQPAQRHHEVSLARLRPGKDLLVDAIMRYGSRHRRAVPDATEQF